MAFPQVAATNTSIEDAADVTSHTVSLPASISSGDLLILIFGHDGSGTVSWPVGYTEIHDALADIDAAGIAIAYRQADGGEGASITVTTSSSQKSAHVTYRITGHIDPATQVPEDSTGATGTSTTPDPDSLTPTGGAKDYLWIACGVANAEPTVDGIPTNYTDGLHVAGAFEGGNCRTYSARRELNASCEDPGTFTIGSSSEWRAVTLAIHPATGMLPFNESLMTAGMQDMDGGFTQ